MINEILLEKAGISAEEMNELKQAWDNLTKAKARPWRMLPCIVCTGIYNAGKSTLLNALLDTEQFPTGDVPTTKDVARVEHDGAVYIDTPGLNAEHGDDQAALSAYEEADFILFVSSAQSGGVSEAEAQWLSRMEKRYTPEGFQRRLIYVLSQDDQVEEDVLPVIQDRFEDDLKKTLGFVPEKVFCVDSVTYLDGKARDQQVLISHSGIPALRAYLTERIASAERELEEAAQAELAARRREALAVLDRMKAACRAEQESTGEEIRKKLTEIDQAWGDLEQELEKAMPPEKVTVPFSAVVSLNYCGKEIEGTSSFDARNKLKEQLRPYFKAQKPKIREKTDQLVSEACKCYCSNGMNSPYFKTCDTLNNVFRKSCLSLEQIGVTITHIEEISVNAEIPSDIEGRIREGAFERLHLDDYGPDALGVGGYIDRYCEMHTYPSYKKGLFGREIQVEMYYPTGEHRVVHEWEEDMRKCLERAVDGVDHVINLWCWRDFCKKLLPEIKSRKAELKKQVHAHRRQLEKSMEVPAISAALEHLAALKKEVSA